MNNHHDIVYVGVNADRRLPNHNGDFIWKYKDRTNFVQSGYKGGDLGFRISGDVKPNVDYEKIEWLEPLKDVFVFTKEELDNRDKENYGKGYNDSRSFDF